jgi:hypothetical protein
MLPVLSRPVMASPECEDQWVVTLQLAQAPHGFGVVRQLVVGKDAAGHNVGTHGQTPLCGFAVKRRPMCHLSRPSKSLVDPRVETPRSEPDRRAVENTNENCRAESRCTGPSTGQFRRRVRGS